MDGIGMEDEKTKRKADGEEGEEGEDEEQSDSLYPPEQISSSDYLERESWIVFPDASDNGAGWESQEEPARESQEKQPGKTREKQGEQGESGESSRVRESQEEQ
ncbi:spore wall protein 2-like, partial [Homarus americanus]|uniref:spore wall protein 2-like n=1 Tax=Homarus americanus TaxID=6706 RepID=UPI001C438F1A